MTEICVKYLLLNDLVSNKGEYLRSLLDYSAENYSDALQAVAGEGHLEIVQLLLEKGADVNAQGGYYGNTLNAAAKGGYLEIFQLLLGKGGADINAVYAVTGGGQHGIMGTR